MEIITENIDRQESKINHQRKSVNSLITLASFLVFISATSNFIFKGYPTFEFDDPESQSLITLFSLLFDFIGVGILFLTFRIHKKIKRVNEIISNRKFFIVGIIWFIISTIPLLMAILLGHGYMPANRSIINAQDVITFLVSMIYLIYIYLDSESSPLKIFRSYIDGIEPGIEYDLKNDKREVKSQGISVSDEEQIDEILRIRNIFRTIIYRLTEQKNSMTKFANLNLTIGITISIGGVIALLVLVQMQIENSSLQSLKSLDAVEVLTYFSRISMVIFIEILALFFLRLYKENLNDKKYYQNEITNVELKYVGFLFSNKGNNPKDVSKVIENFLVTERNFKLGRGESTVALKQINMENSFLERILPKIFDQTFSNKK